jgi:hypothetical protein
MALVPYRVFVDILIFYTSFFKTIVLWPFEGMLAIGSRLASTLPVLRARFLPWRVTVFLFHYPTDHPFGPLISFGLAQTPEIDAPAPYVN